MGSPNTLWIIKLFCLNGTAYPNLIDHNQRDTSLQTGVIDNPF